MKNVDYSVYGKDGDVIPPNIFETIKTKFPDFFSDLGFYEDDEDDEDEDYDNELPKFKLHYVESPFILADNEYDLREANNEAFEIGVKKVKTVIFTGGAFYTEYVKDGEGIIVHGNLEEGFNIFILK